MWGCDGRLGYDANDKDPESWLKTQFPARYIYEKILPEAVAEHSPDTEYHSGSPYGNVNRPDGGDLTIGDAHQWNVWHGSQEPYQEYDKLAGRFVSEFGMEAYPSVKTIDSYLCGENSGENINPTERSAFSKTVEFHNKATGGARKLAMYLVDNLRFEYEPLEAFVYSTQLMQAEALSCAFRYWRRNWKGPKRELTGGALVWQMNDCWPATSWSIADYNLRPKLAYFAIKRELSKIALGFKRIVVTKPRDRYTRVHIAVEHRIEVWMSSFLLKTQPGPYSLLVKAFHVKTGEILAEGDLRSNFEIPANRSTELISCPLPGWTNSSPNGDLSIVVALYLVDHEGNNIARAVSWPDPLKHVDIAKHPDIRAVVWEGKVRISADKPVKGLEIMGGQVDNNGFDVVPGDTMEVDTKDAYLGCVKVRWYGGGERGVDARKMDKGVEY
jgi:beta-mannosidase